MSIALAVEREEFPRRLVAGAKSAASSDTAGSEAGSWPDLVPPGLLERVRAESRAGTLSHERARELHDYLVRLGHREALCRRLVGRLARPMVEREGYNRLGFARLGDYSRERLGMSASELKTLIRVNRALDHLPAVREAYERGELGWSRTRLLARVATLFDERLWLERARTMSTAALERAVAEARGRARSGRGRTDSGGHGMRNVPLPAGETIDGEPAVVWRMACPRPVRALWRTAIELARRVAGEQLPAWQAVEAIAAEALAGAERRSTSVEEDGAPSEPDRHERLLANLPLTAGADDEDDIPSCGRRGGSSAERQEELVEPDEPEPPFLSLSAPEDAVPDGLAALADGACALDPFELDSRLREVRRAAQRVDWQTGRLLRAIFDLGLYRPFDSRSFEHYVREHLRFCPRRARALLRIDRALDHSSRGFADAYKNGRLSWLKAVTLLPALNGPHGRAWVERGCRVTLRRLVEEVEWARNEQDAHDSADPVAPPPPGARLDPSDRQIGVMHEPDEGTDGEASDLVEVRFYGPVSVLALTNLALLSYAREGEPGWRALRRMLEHVINDWTALPGHRNPIFKRDRWRCTVPCCTSRRSLEEHHLVFRSHGGDNEQTNRTPVCAWHHYRAVHHGTVKASGPAPDRIRWQLGVRPGAAPLMTLEGEWYSDS